MSEAGRLLRLLLVRTIPTHGSSVRHPAILADVAVCKSDVAVFIVAEGITTTSSLR